MNKCIKCGSYAFNLIDQGGLCDVHYWQDRAHRAEALAQPDQFPFKQLEEELTKIAELQDHIRLLNKQLSAQPEQEALDTPLPCDVTVGHVTIRKGVALSVLVSRMQVLYDMAQSTSERVELSTEQREALTTTATGIPAFAHTPPQRKPEQEPVAWMTTEVTTGTQVWLYKKTAERYQNPPTPLFTTPPQRKPLTDEQIWDAYMKAPVDIDCHVSDLHKFARAIEAAHGIKE